MPNIHTQETRAKPKTIVTEQQTQQQQIKSEDPYVSLNNFDLDGPIQQVVWCGSRVVIDEDKEKVDQESADEAYKKLYVLTDLGTVWRSKDMGKTIENINKFLEQKLSPAQPYKFHQLHLNAKNSTELYMFSSNGVSFFAETCGKKYTSVYHHEKMEQIKVNKLDSKNILGLIPNDCKQQKRKECKDDEFELHITKDQGKNWKKILDDVASANWDKLHGFMQMVPQYRIIAAHRNKQLSGKMQSVISQSEDYFKTKQIVQENAFAFHQSPHYLFVLLNFNPNVEEFQLKIAPSFFAQGKLQNIDLPFTRERDHSFTILDSTESQIFLSINHQDRLSQMSNVYMSDARGQKFVLSVENTVRDVEGNVDIERINSQYGTFIANVYDRKMVDRYKDLQKSNNKKDIQQFNLQQYKRTIISYDKGSIWHTLKAPSTDNNCSGDCSLHLKGRTESFGNPIYTTSSAPGIILATGNTGFYLNERDTNLNTYLSRDGGYEWEKVATGSHMYEVADHGGLIVIITDIEATNKLSYSYDEGQTWNEIEFHNEPIEVKEIKTEPTNMDQVMFITGRFKGEKNERGVLVKVDFKTLHVRQCEGSWKGGKDSDYEVWVPHNFKGDKCILGRSWKYLRRKRGIKCFNTMEHDKIIDSNICPCTEEDWECVFGFYRNDKNECAAANEKYQKEFEKQNQPPQNCKGTYLQKSAYQNIPGTFCQSGVNLGPKQINCPTQSQMQQDQDRYNQPQREKVQYQDNQTIHVNEQPVNNVEPYNQWQQEQGTKNVFQNNNQTNNTNSSNGFKNIVMVVVIIGLLIFIRKQMVVKEAQEKPRGVESQGLLSGEKQNKENENYEDPEEQLLSKD